MPILTSFVLMMLHPQDDALMWQLIFQEDQRKAAGPLEAWAQMSQNLASTTFCQCEQVSGQPRFKAKKRDLHFCLGRVAELQRSTCRKSEEIYGSHVCTVFHISLSPGLAIPVLAFVCPLYVWEADLYTLDCLHSSALLLLVECADRRLCSSSLSLGSDNFQFLSQES